MHPAFAAALKARRDEYNARFVHARRLRPELDGEAFKQFFDSATTPLVRSVEALDPSAVDPLVSSAFDVALELVAQRLAGPAAPHSAITPGWTELAPLAGRFLRDQPQTLLSHLSNALFHLGALGGDAAARWRTRMLQVLPLCLDLGTWLRAGQVSAWLSGMAQYRPAALHVLAGLDAPLQRVLLQLPAQAELSMALTELALNPWFDPRTVGTDASQHPVVAAQVGSFSGFGGPFVCPPKVTADGASLYVNAGESCWELLVDAFGQHLSRIPDELFAAAPKAGLPPGWSWQGTELRAGQQRIDLGGAGAISSYASTPHTVLVTHACSHRITVIGLRP